MTARVYAPTALAPTFSDRILACLKAPGGYDETTLEPVENGLFCPQTGKTFPFIEGVLSLYAPLKGEGEDVTRRVKSFYEENPFPNYEGLEEFGELVGKGTQNPFSANLLKAIGYNKTVLECGCGTGQLTHFLQLNNNHVLGVDMSLGSLRLAVEHKRLNGLARSGFAQMNIFDPAVKDNSFDVVIAHGVLHQQQAGDHQQEDHHHTAAFFQAGKVCAQADGGEEGQHQGCLQ